MTFEMIEFPSGLDLSAFDDYHEYVVRAICEAIMVPSWILRGYQTKEDYELAELKYWIQLTSPLPG